jgi:hypothetical protein
MLSAHRGFVGKFRPARQKVPLHILHVIHLERNMLCPNGTQVRIGHSALLRERNGGLIFKQFDLEPISFQKANIRIQSWDIAILFDQGKPQALSIPSDCLPHIPDTDANM